MKNKIGIIILAAGNSSRLGQPKQLLPYKGKSLLRHVTDEALSVKAVDVVVVTGAANAAIEHELKVPGITIVRHETWAEGMGTSIKKGLQRLLGSCPQLSAVIIAVCDQPFVSAELFRQLIAAYQHSDSLIVASAYAGTFGTPALYDASYFKDLLALQGPEGAKKILQEHKTTLALVPFEKGNIDIDTMDDYQKLAQ